MNVTLGPHQDSDTSEPLLFGLKGNTNRWTSWFSRRNFTEDGATYTWYQEIEDVGNITEAVVLNRAANGVFVRTIGVNNDVSYTFDDNSNGVWLKYANRYFQGSPKYDGCAFAHVDFVNNNYTSGVYMGEHFGGERCPYWDFEGNFLPTIEPTLSPTTPTEGPIQSPTNAPVLHPTGVPSAPPTRS